jgi:membrane peptidoglycan carboxypeptidase
MGEQGALVRFGPAIKPERSLKPYQEALVALLKLVVDRGTGRAAALDGFAAGKTGTSQNYRDAWFIGFDEGLVVGVWVGNDDDAPMKNMTGGKLPAAIWRDFLIGARKIAAGGPRALEASVVSGSASQCAYRACAQTYRSFRSSDCTYQPYSGPRKLCDK